MARGRARAGAAKPHSKKKAASEILSPDAQWAASVRERVLADCHPFQRDAVEDPSPFFTMLVGRGGGKTTAFKARFVIDMAETMRGRFIFCAPTLGAATELLWEPMQATCAELGIKAQWQESPREGGKIVTFDRTKSRLKLLGADNRKDIGKLRGQPFDGVAGDEICEWDPDLVEWFIERIITPRLGERDGWLGLGSTPGHILRGPFYDYTRAGAVDKETGKPLHRPYRDRDRPEFAGWDGWSSHAWSLKSVSEIPNAAKLWPAVIKNYLWHLRIKANKAWSDSHPVWMREYLGLWAADHTTTVFKFDNEKNLWSPAADLEGLLLLKAAIAALPKGHTWHFVVADDMGHGDPFACNVFAFSPTDPEKMIWHVYFHERTGMYAKPIAQLTIGEDLNHGQLGGIYGVIGWPDGAVFDADKAHIEELANVYGIRFEKAERKVDYKYGAIELVNGDLIDGRIKVLEKSPLHTQLQELQWKDADSGVLKENPAQANHSTDTLVYGRKLIASLFESGVVTDESKTSDPHSTRLDQLDEIPDKQVDVYSDLLAGPSYGDSEGDPWPE